KIWRRLSVGAKLAFFSTLLLTVGMLVFVHYVLSWQANINHPLYKMGQAGFYVSLVLFTAFMAVAILYSLSYIFVTRPLEKLTQMMQIAEEKDFLIRAPVYSDDRIGALAAAFNRLMERMTSLDAVKLETERKLIQIQEELKYQEALEERNRRLTLLYEIARTIGATIEFDDLVNVLTDVIARRLGFKEFAILLWDKEKEALVVKTTIGFSSDVKVQDITFKLGEGASGTAASTREIIYIRDTRNDSRYLHYKGQRKGDGSFVSVPLLLKDQLVGVMNFSRPGIDQFSDEERELLQAMASQIAVAFTNAQLYAETRKMSVRDELTELYNRRYLQQILPMEIKRARRFSRPLALLMIDIDYFKKYNDAFGHIQGDKVLKEFSKLLSDNLREVDSIVRFGGEEFLILLPSTTRTQAFQVAQKLAELVRQHPFQNRENQPKGHFTASFGLSCYPDDSRSEDELVDHADIALYGAKGQGRDQIICYG
ncbi:MAG: diguanylate cyclase, partial [bacterium]|nr:diguanylate cyclase [bacterium]